MIIRNIGTCITMNPSMGKGPLGLVQNAAIVTKGKNVEWVGPEAKLKSIDSDSEEIDALGALVSPGLIDCHTHIAFAGSRPGEFFARLGGDTYEKIAKRGGGILSTVQATREASDFALLGCMRDRLDRFIKFGVTTVEVKSGYGLSVEDELRLLRLISRLDHPVKTIPTFLGAHIVPKEFAKKRSEYVRLVCDEMLPAVAQEKLATACDVFCDKTAFRAAEARAILTRAKKLGLQTKLHADQLSSGGGAELAAEVGALSADHLEKVSLKGIRALAKKKVVGVLLPGAVFSLGKRTYPPARKLIDAGVKVAISTDCNPGTSYSENLPLMMSFAAVELKMRVEEIWSAVTTNAAQALGLTGAGKIQPSQSADFSFWNAETPADLAYHYGAMMASKIVKSGRVL